MDYFYYIIGNDLLLIFLLCWFIKVNNLKDYLEKKLFYISINLKRHFKMNILKLIKDFSGYLSGSSNKRINDYSDIAENIL